MRTLRPQHLRPADWSPIEDQLLDFLRSTIFEPLSRILRGETQEQLELANAAGDAPLRRAIAAGRVQYADGVFTGQFEAATAVAIRRLGGVKDKRTGGYRLAPAKVPGWIREAAAQYGIKVKKVHADILAELDKIEAAIPVVEVDARQTVASIEQGWRKAAEKYVVAPVLSTHAEERLAAEYSDNMKLWVQTFSKKMIGELRVVAQDNAQQGYRSDRLVHQIQAKFGVTERKAKFLAEQETRLFMSTFRKQRFADVGVREYFWRTTGGPLKGPGGDAKARHDHKELNGRRFSYDDPPVEDRATGRRGNPGTGFGCRCVDEPIINPVSKDMVAA